MERDIDGGAFLINCQLGKVSQITRALKYHDQVERLIQYTDPYVSKIIIVQITIWKSLYSDIF